MNLHPFTHRITSVFLAVIVHISTQLRPGWTIHPTVSRRTRDKYIHGYYAFRSPEYARKLKREGKERAQR